MKEALTQLELLRPHPGQVGLEPALYPSKTPDLAGIRASRWYDLLEHSTHEAH